MTILACLDHLDRALVYSRKCHVCPPPRPPCTHSAGHGTFRLIDFVEGIPLWALLGTGSQVPLRDSLATSLRPLWGSCYLAC